MAHFAEVRTDNRITGSPVRYATGGFYPKGPGPGPAAQAQGYPSAAEPSAANSGNGAEGEGPVAGGSGVVIVSEAGQGPFVASGVWSLTEQLKAKKEGNWQ